MKGVIATPDIAKIFHPTPDIEGKKCPTPDSHLQKDNFFLNSHFGFDVISTVRYERLE